MKKEYLAFSFLLIAFLIVPCMARSAEVLAPQVLPDSTNSSSKDVKQENTESKNDTAFVDETHTPADTQQEKRQKNQSQSNANNPQDAQKIFEESLRQMMPLNDGQIHEFRERSDKRERALLPVSPGLASRTVRVSLEPGQKPVSVHTTANVATSLVFHDSTGQPWPITSVTNGAPSFFQVLRPELPEGNLLNVMPTQGYATSTIVVTLEKRDVPLVIRLESDSVRGPERKADALVLFQMAHHGPRANVPLVKDFKETANSTMLSFLDRVPPKNSVRLQMNPASDELLGWEFEGKHYLRSLNALVWPAWSAVINGAGNVKCYEVMPTSRVMISKNGEIQTIQIKKEK